MSTLHTVNKSPFEKTSLAACLGHVSAGAAVLLIEDGVYAALTRTRVEGQVKGALDSVKVYALGPDLAGPRLVRGSHHFRSQRRRLCRLRGSCCGARQGSGLVVIFSLSH